MAPGFAIGDEVQTPLGKGLVREVRNSGRLLVQIGSRLVVIQGFEATAAGVSRRSRRASPSIGDPDGGLPRDPHRTPATRVPAQVDLHGLTVEEALARVDDVLNDALLADRLEVRFIHGRSGGRIRAALHRRLGQIGSVRGFRMDPRNEGVTIVRL